MKISVITVTYNSEKTLQDTINSVKSQTYKDVEYIVIDGGSVDNTISIIKSNLDVIDRWISEKDSGIYDAMNKGIRLASGEIVGTLNSDDFFSSDSVLEKIANTFEMNKVDCVFGDVRFVSNKNEGKVLRYYNSSKFKPWKLRFGFMPAHPSFYTYKSYFDRIGGYSKHYRISGDFEFFIRFFWLNKMSFQYLPICIVDMRIGGVSTGSISSNLIINRENLAALNSLGIYSNYLFLYSRYFSKVFQFCRK